MGNIPSSPEANGSQAPAAPPHVLTITATEVIQGNGIFESWKVSLTTEDFQLDDLQLQDPFEPLEEEQLRWLVEDHARLSPYESSRASVATNSLKRYARVLLDCLLLSQISAQTAPLFINITAKEGCFGFHKLHWEVLESLDLWPEAHPKPSSVIVRRLIPSCLALSPSDRKQRILIVTSRPKGSRDIPHRLISYPVIRILDQMRRDNGIDIKAEIVRPGTWDAVQNHLQMRGAGYFDMVHFDVHGCINNGRGCLKFLKSMENIAPRLVDADEVGIILNQYGIRSVLLNACESAKSTKDPRQNFAEGLLRHGISEVAAMSYSVLASAAEKFVEIFYKSFFLSNLSFVEAVCLSRKYLALEGARNGRFGETLQIPDFFVPVLFCSGTSSFMKSELPAQSSGVNNNQELHFSPWAALSSAFWNALPPRYRGQDYDVGLAGRDDDIAALETCLTPNLESGQTSENIVIIHGMAGIGKSAFSKHLCWWWEATSFVESCIKIEFTPDPLERRLSLAMKRLKSRLEATDVDAVVGKLRSKRHLVVLDNFDKASQGSQLDRGKFRPEEIEEINTFLQTVNGGASLVIITSRSKETWLEVPAQRFRMGGIEDMDVMFEIVNKRFKEMKITRPSGKDIKTLENIIELLARNPSALEMLVSGIDSSKISGAVDELYTVLKRGVIEDVFFNPFSRNFPGVLRAQPMLSIQHLTNRAMQQSNIAEFVLFSLAVLSQKVKKDWFEHIASMASIFGANADLSNDIGMKIPLSLTADTIMQFVVEFLLDTGLLEQISDNDKCYEINPLFTYVLRDKIRYRSHGQALYSFFRLCARKYFMDRCFAMMNISAGALLDSITELEEEATNFFNVFDDMLTDEVDEEALIISDLDGPLAALSLLEQLNNSESNASMQEDSKAENLLSEVDLMSSFSMVSGWDATNTESGIFRLLQIFMMQNINTQGKPFGEETMERCERYLNRLNIHVGTGNPQPIPPNLRMPVITIAGWAAQYWLGSDIAKAMEYVDLALDDIFGVLRRENDGRIPQMFLLLEGQLRLLKAAAAILSGDEDLAKVINEEILSTTFEEEDAGVFEAIARPLFCSLKVNAAHSLYNIALGTKSIVQAEPEKALIDAALADLEKAVGPPPGDRTDDEFNIQDTMRAIMTMWNMSGISRCLGLDHFTAPRMQRDTYLTQHGMFWADDKIKELEQKYSDLEEFKARLQRVLERAINTEDFGATLVFHDRLIDHYVSCADWEAACHHLSKINEMQSRGPLNFMEGSLLMSITPNERLMKSLRNGICLLRAGRCFSAAQTFHSALGRVEAVHTAFIGMDIDTQSQFGLFLAGLGENWPIEELATSLADMIPWYETIQNRDQFETQIVKIPKTPSSEDVIAQEDVLSISLLGLDVSLYLGKISSDNFRSSIKPLADAAANSGFLPS